ncbi:MAG: hypothetical protein AAF081_02985 [Actinomycetota bacterium]
MSLPTAPSVPDDAVVVSVPAEAAHFRVLRLTAAVVAGDLLDVGSVEDAQIGVEEAASILLDATPTGRIEAAFWCEAGRLRVRMQGATRPVGDDPDDFRRTILAAIVDDVEVVHDAASAVTTVRFDKQA